MSHSGAGTSLGQGVGWQVLSKADSVRAHRMCLNFCLSGLMQPSLVSWLPRKQIGTLKITTLSMTILHRQYQPTAMLTWRNKTSRGN